LLAFTAHVYYNGKIAEDNADRAYRIHGTDENSYRILVGKREGTVPLLRLGHRLEDGIKIHLKEKGFEDVDSEYGNSIRLL
jgi:hypothetical protein